MTYTHQINCKNIKGVASILELLRQNGFRASPLDTFRDCTHVLFNLDTKSVSGHREFSSTFGKLVTFEEILVLLEPKTAKVKLNDKYEAVISDGKITIGCQSFPFSVVDELVKAINFVKT